MSIIETLLASSLFAASTLTWQSCSFVIPARATARKANNTNHDQLLEAFKSQDVLIFRAIDESKFWKYEILGYASAFHMSNCH